MAEEKTFNFIFDVVYKCANRLAGGSIATKSLQDRLARCKRGICGEYSALNTSVKRQYMEKPTKHDIPVKLDRHKCATLFMISFLRKFDIPENELNKECMAINVGLLLLRIFIALENKDDNNTCVISWLKANGGFVLPKCTRDDEPYWLNWALDLYYAREADKLFALTLSDKLFHIEKYNRLRAGEQEIDGRP